jgi:hypothetical protein
MLTLPATRRLLSRLAGPAGSRRRLYATAVGWWLLTVAILPIYVALRSNADSFGAPVHGGGLERQLFGTLPSVQLQEWFWNGSSTLEWAVVIVHSSWFFVPLLVGIAVIAFRPDRAGSFVRWWIATEMLVIPFFALLPTRPPWMESDEVVRIVALRFGGQVDDSNMLAAMPSLHVAFPFIIGLWFAKEAWWKPASAMFAYSALIAIEVVFSGEHYVMDVAGAVLFGLSVAVLARVPYEKLFRHALATRGSALRAFTHRRFQRMFSSERGQALIEMAFVLPLMFVFLLALVDFGIAIDRREVLQHAVYEGSRRGIVGTTIDEIKARTVEQSQGLLTEDQITVCYIDNDANGDIGAGDDVRVSADYDYNFTVGGGEMLTAFGVTPPSIALTPHADARLANGPQGSEPTC